MVKKAKHQQTKHFQLPKPLNKQQSDLIYSLYNRDMTIVNGSAGTGKTFLTAVYAAYFYHQNKVDKIILTRPTVPVSRTIGHLPGTLEEKMAPWAFPFVAILEDYLGKGEVECMVKNGKLEIVPFELIRGRSWSNSFIVLDEAQNATIEEVKAFVTRFGEGSKMVVNGDEDQSDLKMDSGLSYLLDLLEDVDNEKLASKVGVINIGIEGIVRSELCALWVKAFS